MNRSILSGFAATLLVTLAPSQQLEVGADAPALHIAKWVKGAAVESFAPGRVYVVEFWATWCGPCVASMPHLSHLQAEWQKKGVTIVGVTTEDPNNSLAAVEAMVADKGDGMGYTVAWDDGHKTNEAFMKAAKRNGIPCAFVVDGKGKLAYIGHPMFLDLPIAGVVAGTWDPAAGQQKIDGAMKRLSEIGKGIAADTDASNAEVKAFVGEFPFLAERVLSMQFQALLQGNKIDRASAVGAALVDKAIAAKDATALNEIAWAIVDPDSAIGKRDLDLARRAAEAGVEYSKAKDANILDTLARVWFWKQDYQKAVELQRKAVAVGGNPDLAKTLAEYEKLAAEAGKKGETAKAGGK